MTAVSLPRIPLIQAPTPLQHHKRLAAAIGGIDLFVKREDLSGFALGGNKPRQLEFILGDALARGADTLVTTAGLQSNFCRTAAAAAAHAGLRCRLILRGRQEAAPQGNLLLDHLFGAEVETIDDDDPYSPRIRDRLAAVAAQIGAGGGRPYVAHLPGETGGLTAAGATSMADELTVQFRDLGEVPQLIYIAAGSGLTLAGLALGLKARGVATRVVGISVQQPAGFLKPLIVERAVQAAALLGLPTRLEPGDFDLDDDHRGPGYGVPSTASLDALALAGRAAGLVCDPVYTGKALAGLIAHARAGSLDRGTSVVFIHTGGAPSLFAHAPAVAEHLAECDRTAGRRAGASAWCSNA